MKRYLLIIFIISIFAFQCNDVNAQLISKLKAQKLISVANNYLSKNDLLLAIEYYEKAKEISKNDTPIITKLAYCYKLNKEYDKALSLYDTLIYLGINSAENTFNKALCIKALGDYNAALAILTELRTKSSPPKIKRLIDTEISNCKFAIKEIKQPRSISIFHPKKPFNDIRNEYAPFFLNDTSIIFAATEPESKLIYTVDDTVPLPQTQLYRGTFTNEKWQKQELFDDVIINTGYNTQNATYSLDNQILYFNVCFENWQHKRICQLYESQLTYRTFSKPILLSSEINSIEFSATHPTCGSSYNNDLEIIYFSSDRPGGYGGSDIWFTVYNKKLKTYSKPRNSGSKINSAKDEINPFYNNSTKTLYFSSNGGLNMGGFDIFRATGELKRWMQPKNLGYPFNTSADEIEYSQNQKQNMGFIVSNRLGSYSISNRYCCFDLFYFKYNEIDQITLKGKLIATLDTTIEKYLAKGMAYHNQDSVLQTLDKYYKNTIVSLFVKDITVQDSFYITSDTANKIGEYLFNVEKDQEYNLVFHENNQVKGQLSISTNNDSILNKTITLNPMHVSIVPDEALIIKNIFYDFNVSNLSDESKQVLDSTLIPLLKEKPGFKIEISSHTDSVGDENYNLILSEQRAQKVKFYLIQQGILKNRIKAIGYGETQPIAPNTFPNGEDNIVGRKLNRRTEFRIIRNDEINPFEYAR